MSMLIGEILDNSVREHRDVTAVQWLKKREVYGESYGELWERIGRIRRGLQGKEMKGKHLIRVVFSENSSFEPVIGNMILHFKRPVNILYADTKDIQGTATGEMILQLPDQPEIAEQMSAYLRDRKLTVGEVDEHVSI